MSEIKRKISFPSGICTRVCLDFLEFMRSIGLKYEGVEVYRLRDICIHMNKNAVDMPVLSKDTVIDIAQRRDGEAQGTQLNRIRLLRKLAEYMVSMGFDAYIVPKNFAQKYKYDFKPYIFSREQISDISNTAGKLKYNPCSPYAHLVIPAILRVFFGCGLRSAEARMIRNSHVDLDNGVLFIEKSKKNISRYVPMSQPLTEYLRNYADEMGFSTPSDAYFFPSSNGEPYHEKTLRDRFRKLLSEAGITVLNNGKLPRLHDARHSFIVHSYKKLTGELGMDFYTALPIIAAYVGHTNINDTERYIHLPAFDYSSITSAGSPVTDVCVPEVTFDA